MSNNVGILLYRINIEIWVGFEKDHINDGLDSKASELLSPVNNLLFLEDEQKKQSTINFNVYLQALIDSGILTKEMIPCSLGTFLEQGKPKRKDKKRQWRMFFSCLGGDLDFSQYENNV